MVIPPNVHIVVPVRDNLPLTRSLLAQIGRSFGWSACWILDNGSVDSTPAYLADAAAEDPRIRPLPAPDRTIYDLWDEGFSRARDDGADLVAILNNDLRLASRTFERLAWAFADPAVALAYPDYDLRMTDDWVDLDQGAEGREQRYRTTSGSFRHGGMSGFCFMLRVAAVSWSPLVDPAFRWWYGDDDLAFTVEKHGGKQVRVVGLPVTHLGGATAEIHPTSTGSVPADEAACRAKWGR